MNSKDQIMDRLVNPGIIAVVRAQKADQVHPMAEALVRGGVVAIEITMTTPHALDCIRRLRHDFGSRALIGVGTVVDTTTCLAALEAGAEFVVSPILRSELVAPVHAAGRPVMLGAYTPTEAQLAHEAGSDFVKIFPADALGPKYIKGIRAPLPHLRIVPTGGVNLDTAADFLKAGCAALGVGSALVSRQILAEANWAELQRLAQAYVQITHNFRQIQK